MVQLSLLEQIKIIVSVIFNSRETRYIIPIIIFISMLLIVNSLKRMKSFNRFYAFIYISILAILIYLYQKPLLHLLDYLVETIVNNLLFPDLAVYIFVLLIANLIVIISLLNNNIKCYVKNINIIMFTIMETLLFFIAKIIINNQINVYEKLTIYTNQELLVLIEFSMLIFTIWMIILLIIKAVNIIAGYHYTKVNTLHNKTINYPKQLSFIPVDNLLTSILPNQVIIDGDIKQDNSFIEYVPIKKKEFRTSSKLD